MASPGNLMEFVRRAAVVLTVAVLAGCAAAPTNDPEALAEFQEINDPAERVNRAIFGFNQGLDKAVIKPVTGAYRAVAPDPVRQSVHNFLANLGSPVTLFNDILQGEFKRAMTTAGRFIINSTAGLIGLFDQAAPMGLEPHREDFGQTLAVWGFEEGPYLMLPVLGPSNYRDTIGFVVDTLMDPLNLWANNTDREHIAYSRTSAAGIDTRDQLWDVLDDLEKSSIDFYAAIRSLYRQRRADEIKNGGKSGADPAPGFGGDFEIADPGSKRQPPTGSFIQDMPGEAENPG